MDRIGIVSRGARFQQVLAVSVNFQFQVRIGHHTRGSSGMLPAGGGLLPFFAEEKRGTGGSLALAFSLALLSTWAGSRLLRENAAGDPQYQRDHICRYLKDAFHVCLLFFTNYYSGNRFRLSRPWRDRQR